MTPFDWKSHRWAPQGVHVRYQPREIYAGRGLKPGMAELAGAELTVRPLWLMDIDDPYPGEWALGAAGDDRMGPVLGDLLWIASGDVVVLGDLPQETGRQCP